MPPSQGTHFLETRSLADSICIVKWKGEFEVGGALSLRSAFTMIPKDTSVCVGIKRHRRLGLRFYW